MYWKSAARFRWTTRRAMLLVALAALFLAGLAGPPSPGWHVAVPGTGLRLGACRDDAAGLTALPDGRRGRGTFRVGLWRPGGGGVAFGLVLRDGGAAWHRDGRVPVVIW